MECVGRLQTQQDPVANSANLTSCAPTFELCGKAVEQIDKTCTPDEACANVGKIQAMTQGNIKSADDMCLLASPCIELKAGMLEADKGVN